MYDAYLSIQGVEGESTRKGFEKWIEIHSFSWGASNPVTIGAGTSGAAGGKASISSFNIMKKTDAASPLLFQACCAGQHFATAKVTLNKAAGSSGSVDFITYEFSPVFIESVQWSGSSGGDDTPTESISISFGKVQISYTPQDSTGAKGSPIRGSWDLQTVST